VEPIREESAEETVMGKKISLSLAMVVHFGGVHIEIPEGCTAVQNGNCVTVLPPVSTECRPRGWFASIFRPRSVS
jgi:hypothetical protein